MKTYPVFTSKQSQYHLGKRLTFQKKIIIIFITSIILLMDMKFTFQQTQKETNTTIEISQDNNSL